MAAVPVVLKAQQLATQAQSAEALGAAIILSLEAMMLTCNLVFSNISDQRVRQKRARVPLFLALDEAAFRCNSISGCVAEEREIYRVHPSSCKRGLVRWWLYQHRLA